MDRKGELTTQQIITIIIIIISFVVLLYFLFKLNPGETSSKQICYNSVALISKGRGLIGSLDCRTNYLCLSGGESCPQFNPTNTANIDSAKKDEAKNETLKALADEMADCWWMFGEGKVDYASGGTFEKVSCSICSISKFDDKLQKQIPTISYQDLYNYLRTTPKTSSQSYLQYIYSANTLDIFQELNLKNYLSNNIDTSKEYFILTGIAKEGWFTTWSWPWNPPHKPYPVVIIEKTKENYDAVGCDEFITKAA